MAEENLQENELLILGLIAEMPRHGYELEGVIEKRAMREWTRIGFSSIYYVLGKLEKRGLISADTPESAKAKKLYTLTDLGKEVLIDQTLSAITTIQPTYPSLLLGMLHLSVLTREQVLDALETRINGINEELDRIKNTHFEQQPLPDHVDTIFEYSIGQLTAELDWLNKTRNYMTEKPWLG
jgi:DNA-binding PadR family transcriptional regulator